jgi:hypothetical protein
VLEGRFAQESSFISLTLSAGGTLYYDEISRIVPSYLEVTRNSAESAVQDTSIGPAVNEVSLPSHFKLKST